MALLSHSSQKWTYFRVLTFTKHSSKGNFAVTPICKKLVYGKIQILETSRWMRRNKLRKINKTKGNCLQWTLRSWLEERLRKKSRNDVHSLIGFLATQKQKRRRKYPVTDNDFGVIIFRGFFQTSKRHRLIRRSSEDKSENSLNKSECRVFGVVTQ